MEVIHAFRNGLGFILRWTCIILFALLILVVLYQVFLRQIMQSGDARTEVLSRILFIWHGLIGAAYVIGENDDVAIDFLVRKFPKVVVKAFEVLAHSIVAFFAGWVMIYGGYQVVSASWDDTVQLLPVTSGQLNLVLIIAGALIVVYSLVHILEVILNPEIKVVDLNTIDIEDIQDEVI